MKKTLLILALAMISFANAQKGTVLVGGNIGYSSTTRDFQTGKDKNSQFNFSPRVGYQFNDNWTVGGEFTVGSSKSELEGTTESKLNDFKAGAFLRYSVPLSEIFSVFADLGAGFQNRKNTINSAVGDSESEADGIYSSITPALFINMKKGFGLNFSIGGLGYETLSYDNNGPDLKNLYFNFGQTFSIGVSKNF